MPNNEEQLNGEVGQINLEQIGWGRKMKMRLKPEMANATDIYRVRPAVTP